MARPSFGVLAGMGPRSTAPFIDMIVSECQIQEAHVRPRHALGERGTAGS